MLGYVLSGGLLASVLAVGAASTPIASTTSGSVSGVEWDGVSVFHSIPFAAPPTGENRFKAPQPLAAWDGVKDASGFAPLCPQIKVWGEIMLGKEDCLYLNVYAPPSAIGNTSANLPVMFWIYGGGWVFGDGWEFGFYDGTNTVKNHDVIVVAPNYRLGPLGFMALDELKEEDPNGSTGNMALQDQTAALKWVQENIQNFGGDPSRVAIYGESAGGFSVCWHMVSATSKGLFQAAMMESGNCDSRGFWQDYDYAVNFGETWAASVGCNVTRTGSSGVLDCLRGKDTQEVMKSILDWFSPDWPCVGSTSQCGNQGLGAVEEEHTTLRGKFGRSPPNNLDEEAIATHAASLQRLISDPDLVRSLTGQSRNHPETAALLASAFALHEHAPHVLGALWAASPALGLFLAQTVAAAQDQRTGDMKRDTAKVLMAWKDATTAAMQGLPGQTAPVAGAYPLPALGPIMPWGAAIDQSEAGLLDLPLTLLRKGEFNKASWILGTNKNDGTIFVPAIGIVAQGASFPPNNASLALAFQKLLNPYPSEAVQAQIPMLLGAYPESAYDNSGWARAADALTDFFFACPARRAARAVASNKGDAYLYQYDADLGNWIEEILLPILGNYHTSEIPLVFDNEWPPVIHDFDSTERSLSQAMQRWWTNQASGGSPNAPATPAWPKYTWANSTTASSATDDQSMALKWPLEVVTGLNEVKCNLWDRVMETLEAALGRQV